MTPENAQDVVQLLRTRAVNEHIDFQDHKNRVGNREGFEVLDMNEDSASEIRKLRKDLQDVIQSISTIQDENADLRAQNIDLRQRTTTIQDDNADIRQRNTQLENQVREGS